MLLDIRWIYKINYSLGTRSKELQMSILSILIYRFNAMPMKHLRGNCCFVLLYKMWQAGSKFCMENGKSTKNSQGNHEGEQSWSADNNKY